MNIKAYIGLAAACLLGVPASAQTFASASAELRNIRITLVDLNPDDGIAPAIWASEGATPFLSVQADTNLYGGTYHPVPFTGLPLSASTVSVSGSGYAAQAWRGADVLSATAEVGQLGLVVHGTAWFDTYVRSSPGPAGDGNGLRGQFLITPHTQLTLSADYEVFSSVTMVNGASLVQASGGVNLLAEVGETPNDDLNSIAGFSFSQTGGPFGLPSGLQTGTLSLTVVNATNGNDSLWLSASATSSAYSEVTAVPEPASVWLSLVGLAGLAAWRSRRKLSGRQSD